MNSLLNITKPVAGFCTSLYNAGSQGANCLGRTVKLVASGTCGAVMSVLKVACAFFSQLVQKGAALSVLTKNTASVSFVNAKKYFAALPRNTKLAWAVGVCAMVAGLASNFCSSESCKAAATAPAPKAKV